MGCLIWMVQLLLLSFTLVSYQINSLSSSSHLCPHDQNIALLQFKQLFSFNSSASSEFCDYKNDYTGLSCYPKMQSWKEDTDCCEWDGVMCNNVTGQVIGLDLSCSWLHGAIHSNSSLFGLVHLQSLNLACNNFNHSLISPSFGRFTSLAYLDLSNSYFSGRIPSEIFQLSELVSLDLSNTYEPLAADHYVPDEADQYLVLEAPNFVKLIQNLTKLRELVVDEVFINSAVPPSLMNLSSLTTLSLVSCSLRGHFPANIFYLPELQLLNLKGNENLTGKFPLFNESTSLEYLSLSFTSFSGELPHSINQLKSLNTLGLSACKFSGSIPESLSNLGELTYLGLSRNSFEGHIPDFFADLPKLTILRLTANKFTGQFPSSLGNLSQLAILEIEYNGLTGPLPSQILARLENLEYLELGGNNFEGQIPDIFSHLPKLSVLILKRNKFTGQFPSSVANLSQLFLLDLSFNQLTGGPFPSEILSRLENLEHLELAANNFEGQIPDIFSHFPKLSILILGGNKFIGQIPSSVFNISQLSWLDLSHNQLTGSIPLQMFSRFEKLQHLDLSYNNLSLIITNSINYTFPQLQTLLLASCNISEFPSFLETLEYLQNLDLSNNKIEGLIPEWLWNMRERTPSILNISHNFLRGFDQYQGIPPAKSPSTLDLQSNMLRGSLFIPSLTTTFYSVANNMLSGELPFVCNLSSIQYLVLSHNNFSGLIPTCLGYFSRDISVLDLQNNSFHGTLPDTFAVGTMLRTLDFSHNQIQGMLPRSLANCTNLEVLNLGHNMMSDTFPSWLETLPVLQVLVLQNNRFYGQVGQPRNRSAFSRLRIIDVSYNDFTGNLPSKYFEIWNSMMIVDDNFSKSNYMADRNGYYYDSMSLMNKGHEMKLERILTIFTALDFSNNKFHAEIPMSIGELKSLHVLNFSGNSLTGQIPLSLGKLRELESLDLSKNNLSGRIPQQLTNLTFLAVFDASQNNLTGPIPRGGQFETFSNTSYKGNLGLCGFPLSKECGNKEEAQPPPSMSKQSQNSTFEMDGFGWKAVCTGMVYVHFPRKMASKEEELDQRRFSNHGDGDSEILIGRLHSNLAETNQICRKLEETISTLWLQCKHCSSGFKVPLFFSFPFPNVNFVVFFLIPTIEACFCLSVALSSCLCTDYVI